MTPGKKLYAGTRVVWGISSPHFYFGTPYIAPKLIQLGSWNLVHW